MKIDGSVSFELLKRAAEEKHARTSVPLLELTAIGDHPWQHPEFIKAHSKRISEQMIDLVARSEYLFQQPEFIEENSKRTSEQMIDLVA